PDSVLINAFPSPDGATRGLAFDGMYLWSADNGDGNSVSGPIIFKLDPNTGAKIDSFASPGGSPFGLAFDGTNLWHSDFSNNTIYKVDTASFAIISSFSHGTGFLFDLAWDGTYLWGALGNTDQIVQFDVNTQTVVQTIPANYPSPSVRPMGMAYIPADSGQIWVCDGSSSGASNLVSQWDFATLTWINQWASNPTSYPDGMAYDSVTHTLWISCWTNDSIYVYDLSYLGIEEEITENIGLFSYSACYLNNSIEIYFSLPEQQTASIKLYNIAGGLISSLENINFSQGNNRITIDASELSSGIYFTTFNSPSYTQTQRIVIAK
ncbi:MAG: T9SS type A sorting domain-containing protein, partial [bacterium]